MTRLASLLCLLSACETSEVCKPITGEIIEGKELPLLAAGGPPHKVVVNLFADTVVEEVHIGGNDMREPIYARLADVNTQKWEAQIFAADLAAYDTTRALELPVKAIDGCDQPTTIDSLRLNAAPNLMIMESHAGDELSRCYLPTEGTDAAIRVSSALGAGAKVKLTSTHGLFGTGAAVEEFALDSTGSHVSLFVPSSPGIAAFSASALGGTADTLFVPIVAPPTVLAPTTALQRGLQYGVTFDAGRGNFRTCSKEELVASSSTVTVLDPDRVLIDTLSVAEPQPSCTSPETVRMRVTFAANASNNAQVTLACSDAYGRFARVTLSVVQL